MRVFLTAFFLIALGGGLSTAALYWCPGGLERERVETTPAPGCEPLVEERDLEKPITLRPLMTLSNSAGVVALFMLHYRRYLACCATDPHSLDVLADLDRQASEILAEQERILPFISVRTGQGKGLMLPVVRARHELRRLKKRLEDIAEATGALRTLDFESAARERRRIEALVESIETDFPQPKEVVSAPTGPEIGTPGPGGRLGMEIGSQPPFGPAIGVTPPTGPEIGTTPPTGAAIGTTPPTGPAIGITPRTGPDIRESTPK